MGEKINDLLQRYSDGKCTPEEVQAIHAWYNHKSKNTEDISKTNFELWNNKIKENLPVAPVKTINNRWIKVASAAAILIAMGFAFLYFTDRSIAPIGPNATQDSVKSIDPGKNGATLTLSNGEKIKLSDVADGEVIKSAGISITKTPDGQLTYHILPEHEMSDQFNTLSTSNGETFRIKLPDGTTVWLNAASSIKYAVSIHKNTNRFVELIGEAYFEVAKDKNRPFIVKTENQKVSVLGTSFNISSYQDDDFVKTTLIEGSVKIEYNDREKLLVPNEQSILKNNRLTTTSVDIESVIAWKNGMFLFQDESLEDIMKKISRWYNVEIDYQQAKKEKLFWGGVSRYDDIKKVLNKLEQTGGLHFKIDGRRIIVTK